MNGAYGASESLYGRPSPFVTDKTFIVLFKPPLQAIQHVVAATAEIQGDHLILLDSRGELSALFLLEIVQDWNEVPAEKEDSG
jgi:hypothetical protein